ncbi:MAG: LysR family transcriptional regulator [Inquilinaceae bacterium]
MQIHHLETFVALARLVNVRRTALSLGLTQSAVSSRLRALEAEFRVKLVDRVGRGIVLTPEGETFALFAERMLQIYRETHERIAADGAVRGRVRIGVIDSVTETWLPRLVERLRATCPDLALDIVADSSRNLVRDLEADRVGLAFLLSTVGGGGFDHHPVCAYAMRLFAGPTLAEPDRIYGQSDLRTLPLIIFPQGTPPNASLERFVDTGAAVLARQSSSNSLMTMVRLVEAGLGLAVMPEAAVLGEIEKGALVRLKTEAAFEPVGIDAVIKPSRLSRALTLVLAEARAVAASYCAEIGTDLAWPVRPAEPIEFIDQ